MRTTRESCAETIGAEWVGEWVRVAERGECDECGNVEELASRKGVAWCRDCIANGDGHEYATADEIAQLLTNEDEFGEKSPATPSEVRAFREGVRWALADLLPVRVSLDDVVTVECSHVLPERWNGWAVPVFNVDQMFRAIAELERVGFVVRDGRGAPVDSEYRTPIYRALGGGEYLVGEGWVWMEA